LHHIPDKVVSEEEAYDTAKRMLSLDADNVLAKEFLKKR
jgi:hypothetical protein